MEEEKKNEKFKIVVNAAKDIFGGGRRAEEFLDKNSEKLDFDNIENLKDANHQIYLILKNKIKE